MKKTFKTISALCFFLILSVTLSATEKNRSFGFDTREIFEFDKKISELHIRDINMDGLDDAVFINNSISKLELLIRKKSTGDRQDLPALDDVFESRGFLLDKQAHLLKIGDLNGDTLPDLLMSGHGSGISIRYQDKKGSFNSSYNPVITHPSKIVEIKLSDLNKDGAIDILVCRKQNAEILFNDPEHRFITRQMIEFSGPDSNGSLVGDFNSDGNIDIFFYFPERERPLSLFTGQENGIFGWEKRLEFPEITYAVNSFFKGTKKEQILAIFKNAKNLKLYELKKTKQNDLFSSTDLVPSRLTIKGTGKKTTVSHLVSDLNGDGFNDLCMTSPELSQIRIYEGNKNGISPTPSVFDSLTHIQKMGLNKKGDLIVFSSIEQAIAIHKKEILKQFPSFVNTVSVPKSIGISPHYDEIFLISEKEQSEEFLFQILDPYQNKMLGTVAFPSDNIPESITVFPLEKDNTAVICFMPYDKPLMFIWNSGTLTPVTTNDFRALKNELVPSDITVIGEPGNIRLLVSEGKTARLYKYENKMFSAIKQYNTSEENASLTHGVPYSGPLNEPGFLILNETTSHLFWFPENGEGKKIRFGFSDSFENLTSIIPFNLKTMRGLVFTSDKEVKWIREKADTYELEALSEYTAQMEHAYLWKLFPIFMGKQKKPMAAILDAQNSSVEIISADNGKLKNEMVFEVFQSAGTGFNKPAKSYEPREISSGDLNGDSIQDLGVLVHDKLIFYIGE